MTSAEHKGTGGASQPKKSSGARIFEAVEKLVAEGMTKTSAFAKVAAEIDRSSATVTATYYQYARTLPDGGGVRKPNRAPSKVKTLKGSSPAGGSTARLAREAGRVMDELLARIDELETQAAADAAELKRLRRILSKV
jgi:hypothetical protein